MMTSKCTVCSCLLRNTLNRGPSRSPLRYMSIRVSDQERSQFSERGYILLSIPLVTFGLGTWQIHRRQWKLDLIKSLEEKIYAPPIPFPEDYINDLPELEYRKVRVQGEFDHSREVLLGPRTLLKDDQHNRGGLMTKGGNSGYHVITPFTLHDRSITILVNRGWVPSKQKISKARQNGQVSGIIDLVGVVRKNEKRPQFTPKNEPGRGMWHYRDLIAMSEYLGTEPVLLDADMDSTIPGGPVGGQTRVSLRNEHASYIFTWYSLCAATLWMWYTRYGRKFLFKKL